MGLAGSYILGRKILKIRRRIININNKEDDCIYQLESIDDNYAWFYFEHTIHSDMKTATPLYFDSNRNYRPPVGMNEISAILKFEEQDLCE